MRRATILTAFALGTGISIKDIFPGQIRNNCSAKTFSIFIFHINADQFAGRTEIFKEIIETGRKDMSEFGKRNQNNKSHHQQQVEPPDETMNRT